MNAEKIKTFCGFKVRTRTGPDRFLYVRSYAGGKYTFCTDYTYAKCFSACKANEHINRINEEE